MSKIANSIEYYDIFLKHHTKEEAVKLLKEAGFYEYDYDPISNSISVRAIEDPSKKFHDMKWKEDNGQYELIW